jgi:glycogen operon protein
MTDGDWHPHQPLAMTVFLNGDAITEPGPHGERVRDDSFLLLLSADGGPVTFTLPEARFGERWSVAADTGAPDGAGAGEGRPDLAAGEEVVLAAHTMMVLRRTGLQRSG